MKIKSENVAAITGAASGMGRELALELARRGCGVAICDVNEEGMAETLKLAAGMAGNMSSKLVDVADRDAVFAWAQESKETHGKINMVFNNAGVSAAATVSHASMEDFEWLMGTNFWGVVHGTMAFLPHIREAGEGHVTNTSSVFGIISVPTLGLYNASKFAVRGYTESLRMELELEGVKIGATSVHPGGIKTNIAKASRVADHLVGDYVKDHDSGRQQMEKLFRTKAADAAKVIIKGVEKNRARVLIGSDAYAIDWGQRLLPTAYQGIVKAYARHQQKIARKA